MAEIGGGPNRFGNEFLVGPVKRDKNNKTIKDTSPDWKPSDTGVAQGTNEATNTTNFLNNTPVTSPTDNSKPTFGLLVGETKQAQQAEKLYKEAFNDK